MKFEIQPSGNLEIACTDPEDKEELQEILDKAPHRDHGFLAGLLEYTGWAPNGRLYQVRPEDIAALTDAPILTDDLEARDDGTRFVHGKVWWFPDYMIRSFAEELIRNGRVVFILAPTGS